MCICWTSRSMIGVRETRRITGGVRHLRRRREKRPEAARRGLPGPIRRRYPRTGEAGAELLAAPGLRYSVPVAGSAQGRKPADGRTVHFGQLCGTRGLPGHGGLPGDGRSGRTGGSQGRPPEVQRPLPDRVIAVQLSGSVSAERISRLAVLPGPEVQTTGSVPGLPFRTFAMIESASDPAIRMAALARDWMLTI